MKKQVALVTGASSGIGEEVAKLLSQKGYKVYAAARRIERMQHLQSLGIQIVSMDVTDDNNMNSAVQDMINKEGRIDVLVNNAGYGSFGSLEDVPLAEAKKQFEVNVFGLARLIQMVLPSMRKHRFGKIVNISSIGGKMYEPMGSWYHATKYAVEGLSDCLRLDVQEFGIDVIIIEPGLIKTEWGAISSENLLKTSGQSAYRDLAKRSADLLKFTDSKASSPKEVAETIYQAVKAEKPKTRYSVGKNAKLILFMRWLLSDRLFDKMMMATVRNPRLFV